MLTKLKTRVNEIKNDPMAVGILVGGVCAGAGAYLGMTAAFKLGFIVPGNALNIPDNFVDHVVETGIPVLFTRNDGVQLALGLS